MAAIDKRYDSAGAVIANDGELRQVLSNLIVNASEALANVRAVCCFQDKGTCARTGPAWPEAAMTTDATRYVSTAGG
jgi:hypothetical protein